MIAADASWEAVQEKLAEIYQVKGLEFALRELYQQQCRAGMISEDLKLSIQNRTKVALTENTFLNLLWAPHRTKRGIADRFMPDPPHRIAYQGGVPCFCCEEVIRYQWPKERGFTVEVAQKPWLFLPNLFPLLNEHFTVVSPEHLPQRMCAQSLLAMNQKVPGAWVIQNGPEVGATNPWHLHFQLFWESELPMEFLLSRTSWVAEGISVTRLETPLSLYRFDIKASQNGDFLDDLEKDFLSLDPHHRLNHLACLKNGEYHVYIALRDTRFRSPFYKTGQPGYAEIAGFISVVNEEGRKHWIENGALQYQELLKSIAVSKETEQAFEALLQKYFR